MLNFLRATNANSIDLDRLYHYGCATSLLGRDLELLRASEARTIDRKMDMDEGLSINGGCVTQLQIQGRWRTMPTCWIS